MATEQSVKGWLTDLTKTNTSSDQDSQKMQNLLRMVGFPRAVVVVGVVYPEGRGRPVNIHSMAGVLLKAG